MPVEGVLINPQTGDVVLAFSQWYNHGANEILLIPIYNTVGTVINPSIRVTELALLMKSNLNDPMSVAAKFVGKVYIISHSCGRDGRLLDVTLHVTQWSESERLGGYPTAATATSCGGSKLSFWDGVELGLGALSVIVFIIGVIILLLGVFGGYWIYGVYAVAAIFILGFIASVISVIKQQ